MRKRVIIISLAILLLVTAAFYVLIPSTIRITASQKIPVPSFTVVRGFNNSEKLKTWWPGTYTNNQKLTFNNYHFKFDRFNISNIQKTVIYFSDKDSVPSLINALLFKNDTTLLYWTCDVKTSLFPTTRLKQYLQSKNIKKIMTEILHSFGTFASDLKNIYDISINSEKVTDSILITERKALLFYPTVTDVYSTIHSLKNYLTQQNAIQTNYPICNITPVGSNYDMVVAIPINKAIKETATKKTKALLYNGKLLTTEVTGGKHTINKAMEMITLFMRDYQLIPAAIPYQTLITDREKNADTSQWITKICFPIY